jgi:hypothetical protein
LQVGVAALQLLAAALEVIVALLRGNYLGVAVLLKLN